LTARWRGFYNRGVSGERGVLTYRDYAALPDDGRRYELHDGELSVTPAPGTRHQRVIGAMYVLLRAHVEARRLGEVFLSPIDCILSDTTVVEPDLVYVDPARAHLVSARAIEGAPTLAVEVLSPATTTLDRSRKRELYARYQIPYYWIVDPEARTVEAYGLVEGRYALLGRVSGSQAVALPPFPDLAFAPASLWP
jgi:Uma2 family endonuclease